VSVVRYQKPDVLARIPHRGHAVIEASAGTGKTYTLEHLVVDLLLTAGASIGDILVVTFTEKATGELKQRVRKLLEKLLQLRAEDGAPSGVPDERCWLLDDAARATLGRALLDFDTATISTIHGFCQRVLGDQAFATRRLFAETLVDGSQAFSSAFREVLREELAREPGSRALLAGWLSAGSVESLEELLYRCARERGRLFPPYEPERIDAALAGFPLELRAELEAGCPNGNERRWFRGRWERVEEAVRAALAAENPGTRLLAVYPLVKRERNDTPLGRLQLSAQAIGGPAAARLLEATAALKDAIVSPSAAVVATFLPPVIERVEKRKREAGLLDFDDMLGLLEGALRGPGGDELVRILRGRYRFALVDEFQDTDELQWAIFRRVFFEGPDSSLFVIGDPKQAIYGFRGADVHAYLAARRELTGAGGALVQIDRNFRSTPAVIEAYNRILDQRAEGPFFTGDIRYDHPVACGNPGRRLVGPDGEPVAPVVLFELRPSRSGASRGALLPPLAARIAREIRAIVDPARGLRFDEGEGDGPEPVKPKDIFVLTRTADEGREIGAALREAGIPHAFFKQDGLFQTDEARHLLDVLAALAAPKDRSARIRAWLTPLFGLELRDLPHTRDLGAEHPLVATLDSWRALAEARQFAELFGQILDGSGLVRRTLLAGNERALTNYGHLAELLLEEVARRQPTIGELCSTFRSWVEDRALPTGESGNVQRLESERDAVQIMTLHKSKGLEAKVVFLAGGFRSPNSSDLHVFHDGEGRAAWIGNPPPEVAAIERQESAEEDQRLLYVGLTRAKGRLYLPYVPHTDGEGGEGAGAKLNGCYRAVNDRLEALVTGGDLSGDTGLLFHREVVGDAEAPEDDEASRLSALAGFVVRPELLADRDDRDFDQLRSERKGLEITSYSRLAGKSHRPVRDDDTADLDRDEEASVEPEEGDLPKGAATGNFLHELLELVPLESGRQAPDPAVWAALPVIDRLLRQCARRHQMAERHLPRAAELVHGAITSPMGPGLPALCEARQVRRELEFLFPIPEEGHPLLSRPDLPPGPVVIHRGFVKGFIDVVFEHDGRVYFADWKSDILRSYDADAVAARVQGSYLLQSQLYSLAIAKFLGLRSQADLEAKFGGFLYVFLRGPKAGRFFLRPSFADIAAWEAGFLSGGRGPGGEA
jgi:exodeoxyribonuclease V beta subunit